MIYFRARTVKFLPAERKLLLVVLLTDMEGKIALSKKKKKALSRSIATYQLPWDVLICSGNKTTSGITAAIGVTTWLSL